MSDNNIPPEATIPEETALSSRENVLKGLHEIGAEQGFFEELGPEHSALFVRAGKTLIVTFENLDHVDRFTGDKLPWGYHFVQSRGWSILGLMAHGWTWYRDEDVHDFFDRLQAEGFFEDFDKVVFYGASMGAYAACTFSRVCPGATVIAISPQATLDRTIAGWERRYHRVWKRNFSNRYGYAPDGLAGADKVYMFYDPLIAPDAMHMALFQTGPLHKFKCRFMGHRIASAMQGMGILKEVIEESVAGTLDAPRFYELLRKRREFGRYQKEMLIRLSEMNRPFWTAWYCKAILNRRAGPAFRKQLAQDQKLLRRWQKKIFARLEEGSS